MGVAGLSLGRGLPDRRTGWGRGTVCLSFPCPPPRIVSNKCLGLDSKPRGQLTR